MRTQAPDADRTEALAFALREAGFTLASSQFREPSGGSLRKVDLRAVRGHCEVHVSFSGEGVHLGIPVVRFGPDRPATALLSDYLTNRNAAGKGPGAFSIEDDTIWYRAAVQAVDVAAVAAAALSMQRTVEKLGPKILNLLR